MTLPVPTGGKSTGTTLDAGAIAALLPHGAGLSLLDAVTAWDARTLHAISRRHVRAGHPLRRSCATGEGPPGTEAGTEAAGTAPAALAAVTLIEYAAQAAAVHIGLLAAPGAAPRGGVLALVRDVRLGRDVPLFRDMPLVRDAPLVRDIRVGRDEELPVATITSVDGDLSVDVIRRGELGGGLVYEFTVALAGAMLAAGKLGIVLRGGAA